VIVTRELRQCGLGATCCLIDPTVADLALVSSNLSPSAVSAVGEHEGELTRSLCLEHTNGQRTWVFSRFIQPNGVLGDITGDLVYLDFYPELSDFLNAGVRCVDTTRVQIIVNLSALCSIADLRSLAFTPSAVQTSVPDNITTDESLDFATQLAEKTGARRAFVTMGHRGAALAEGSNSWYAAAPATVARSFLGAGAVFSSKVITGSLQGLNCRELLDFSVRQTAARLQSSQLQNESDRS
jgi:hypothetical protein